MSEQSTQSTSATTFILPSDLTNEFVQLNGLIKCITCDREVKAKKRFQLTQHLATQKHTKQKALSIGRIDGEPTDDQFRLDLLRSLVGSNIPIFKMNCSIFKSFLHKYTGHDLPNETTLRRSLKILYESTMDDIRRVLNGANIWISVDETTDTLGRCVIIVVVGPLDLNAIGESYCLNVKFAENSDNVVISRTIIDSLHILWPKGIQYDQVHLLLTDGASYMALSASNLKMCFTKMIHITCLAHGLNRVSEFIRSCYEHVDKLISKGKKVFLKAPQRRAIFKQIAPNLPLPPEPCITRWGTWLSAVIYYNSNLNIFKDIVSNLDADEAQSISDLKTYLQFPHLSIQLHEITENYSFLVDYLSSLQSSNLKLSETIQYYREIDSFLSRNVCSTSHSVYDKFLRVMMRNQDFNKIIQIADAKDKSVPHFPYSDSEISNFQSAPITTAEVERKFSQYKFILSYRRTRFTEENLKMYFVIQSNSTFFS